MNTWIGPYELLAEIGRGASGVVYRARRPGGADVALKVIAPGAVDPARRAREVEVIWSLGSELGFVPVLDSGESPQGFYVVMPLLTGGTLRDRLARGPLPAWEVRELGVRLAAALGRAHRAGIVHRDVKPENVLFDARGEALLADLGVAKPLDEGRPSGQASLTRSGDARGTPGYMPLEQLADARSVGPEADVFALGAVLYECLAGSPPFERPNLVELFVALERGAFTPLRARTRNAPSDLVATIERALSKDPKARFAGGSELAHALAQGGERSATRPIGIAAVLASLLVGGAWLATRRPSAPPPPPRPTDASRSTAAVPSFVLAGRLGSSRFRHANPPSALAIGPGSHPDEELAIVGDAAGGVAWWRVREGVELVALAIEGLDEIRAIAPVSGPTPSALVLGSNGRVKRLVPLERSAVELVSNDGKVVAIAAARKKRLVATGHESRMVKLWDVDSSTVPLDVQCPSVPTALAFANDDDRLFIGCASGDVLPVQFHPKRALPSLCTNPQPVEALALSPDGARLAVSLRDGDLSVFDLATGQRTRTDASHVRALAFGPRGTLHGATDTGSIFEVDLARRTGDVRKSVGNGRRPGVAVSSRGEVLYLSAPTGTPRVLGAPADEGHDGHVLALLALPGGTLASSGSDGTVRLWQLGTGRELACVRDHGDAVVSLVAEPGGGLVTASRDGVVVSREAGTLVERTRSRVAARLRHVRCAASGTVWAATDAGLVPVSGERAATSSSDALVALEVVAGGLLAWNRQGDLALVDPRTGETRWRRALGVAAQRGAIALVAEERVAVAGSDSVRLLDVATGRDTWPAPVSFERIAAVAASADGRYLAVATAEEVVLLRAATGEVVTRATAVANLDAITALAFAGDEVVVGLARGAIARLKLFAAPAPGSRP